MDANVRFLLLLNKHMSSCMFTSNTFSKIFLVIFLVSAIMSKEDRTIKIHTFSCPEKFVVVTTKSRIAVVKTGERLSGIGEPSIRHVRRHRGPNNLLKTDNHNSS